MTASWRGRRKLLTAAWGGSALTAAFALIGLLVISGAPGSARLALRADDYNQMTGVGSTASAITVNWTSGLLNAENQPITASSSTDGGSELSPNPDRSAATATSPLSFMYSEFKNIQVTVSQTQNIGQQGITVTWKGAVPPPTTSPKYDFLQMMECYGDSDSGPSPEGCMYGAGGGVGASPTNNGITGRGGFLCGTGGPGTVLPSTANPPAGVGTNGDASWGCDPYEPAAETISHCDPTHTAASDYLSCASGHFYVPFLPAGGAADSALYEQTSLATEFNQYNSNEVEYAPTSADGTGQRQFETLTANQAPGLGCGQTESNGQTRNCWLVIVPRGSYEPNGFQASLLSSPFNYEGQYIDSSPLSAANWAQRIQIHLGYTALATNCPPTVLPRAMVGTQVVYRAVTSWQHALNEQAQCARVYSFTASTENEATTQLAADDTGNAGLAFTTIPIGSEATRSGGSPPTLPNILYAPVAVTALDFGFNINEIGVGQVTTPVKLTPALVARAITQVYKYDLPDYVPSAKLEGPTWAQSNPINISLDPAFQQLNPATVVPPYEPSHTSAPLITGDHSSDNQRIWEYVQSDPATASWLDGGTPDSSDPVQADPDYTALNLGKLPVPDSFPVAYTGTITCPEVTVPASSCGSDTQLKLNSIDMLPVQSNFDQSASTVLSASDSALTTNWNGTGMAPDGSPGWWYAIGGEPPGQVFMWAVNDMSDLAAYGLNSAALCDSAGTNCIQPSTDSVSAALGAATADSAGLLQVNPATVPAGAYPLTDVVYAAVPTDQSAAALTDYADFIAYATGGGQTEGSASGDLPAGYLPLTTSLQTQAQSVVTQLRALAGATSSASASPTTSATGTSSATATQSTSQTTGGGATTGSGATTTGSGGTTTGGGATTTGGGATTTGGGATTTGGGATTTGGTSATTQAAAPGSQPAAGSTCTATATPTAASTAGGTPTPAGTASASQSAAAPASTGCASSTPQAFDVLPPSAEAAAGTTPATVVGSIRDVLIVVLIIGAAGAVAGGLLRYGHMPARGRRSRESTGGR